MAQQVRIDQEECLGCEACVEEAMASCPAGCISKEVAPEIWTSR